MTSDLAGHYLPNYRELLAKTVDEFQCFKETLANTDHTFIFIITKKQWPGWRDICLKYGYDEYMQFEMPYFVHNFNYTEAKGYTSDTHGGRKLRLVIFKGKGKHED
jgi:hypothetical protein